MLEIRNLSKYYPVGETFFSRSRELLRAVDGVGFDVREGETLGLVGESGSGKTTLGRLLVRLETPSSGTVMLDGKNIFDLKGRDLRAFRKQVQIIFQDPKGSFNPRLDIETILTEPMLVHKTTSRERVREEAERLLELVGLPADMLPRYPHEFSGGERQRIGIARSLTLGPRFIVADEPVTALDVSVQGQIMNLLVDLQREFGLTYLLIAHDVGLVCSVAARVAVMYLGRIVEIAPAELLYESPLHPYTRTLLASLPHRTSGNGTDTGVSQHPSGEPGERTESSAGCVFEPRCPQAMDRCRENAPDLREVEQDRFVACFLW